MSAVVRMTVDAVDWLTALDADDLSIDIDTVVGFALASGTLTIEGIDPDAVHAAIVELLVAGWIESVMVPCDHSEDGERDSLCGEHLLRLSGFNLGAPGRHRSSEAGAWTADSPVAWWHCAYVHGNSSEM